MPIARAKETSAMQKGDIWTEGNSVPSGKDQKLTISMNESTQIDGRTPILLPALGPYPPLPRYP